MSTAPGSRAGSCCGDRASTSGSTVPREVNRVAANLGLVQRIVVIGPRLQRTVRRPRSFHQPPFSIPVRRLVALLEPVEALARQLGRAPARRSALATEQRLESAVHPLHQRPVRRRARRAASSSSRAANVSSCRSASRSCGTSSEQRLRSAGDRGASGTRRARRVARTARARSTRARCRARAESLGAATITAAAGQRRRLPGAARRAAHQSMFWQSRSMPSANGELIQRRAPEERPGMRNPAGHAGRRRAVSRLEADRFRVDHRPAAAVQTVAGIVEAARRHGSRAGIGVEHGDQLLERARRQAACRRRGTSRTRRARARRPGACSPRARSRDRRVGSRPRRALRQLRLKCVAGPRPRVAVEHQQLGVAARAEDRVDRARDVLAAGRG